MSVARVLRVFLIVVGIVLSSLRAMAAAIPMLVATIQVVGPTATMLQGRSDTVRREAEHPCINTDDAAPFGYDRPGAVAVHACDGDRERAERRELRGEGGISDASSDVTAAEGAGTAITRGEQVTEEVIRNAMKDAPLSSQQAGGVSLPRVQQYVDKLLAGEVPPAIEVDGSMIVDGNHRYIAGQIVGQDTPAIQWLSGRPGGAVPWSDIPISPEAW